MIKKFAKINNVFSYAFFDWDKINSHSFVDKSGVTQIFDGSFGKNNILFAENGNGKTSLIKALKNANGVDTLLEKHWDYQTADQEIDIVFQDGTTLTEKNNVWSGSELNGKIVIFDKAFIEQYVHSIGTSYDHNIAKRKQERGKHIIYLGNFAQYNTEINRINEVKEIVILKNKAFWVQEKGKLEVILSPHFTYADFEAKNLRTHIEAADSSALPDKKKELQKQSDELAKIQHAITNQGQIERLVQLSNAKGSFSFSIIQKDASGNEQSSEMEPVKLFEFTVSKGIQETLVKIADKKGFIQSGITLIDEQTTECPFCEQSIKNGDFIHIVKEYQAIFDKTFLANEEEIKNDLFKYRKVLEALRDFQAPTANSGYLREIKKYINIETDIPSCSLSEEDKALLNEEIETINSKEKNVLQAISATKFEEIKALATKANSLADAYNTGVADINKKLADLKTKAREGKLAETLKTLAEKIAELGKEVLFIEKQMVFAQYFKAKEIHTANEKVEKTLEEVYQKMKDKIIEEFKNFVDEYFGEVKALVKRISPAMDIFEIDGTATYSRTGKEPAQCGFEIKYNGDDHTHNLSEGERQVIALAFFFAILKKEKNPERVIVLDDPITSFDAGKRKSTAEVIASETKDFLQIFVFTCDPLFREFCLKELPNISFYYIFKTLGASSIHYVTDKRRYIYQSFESDFQSIDSETGTSENIVIYGQKLRFCLETKIKEDYFGYSQDSLSNMIEQVASKGKANMDKLIDNKDVILQIYKYCNTGGLAHYPKDGSTSWNELKDKVKSYLSLNL
jgi:wobble nucleotide-excising tRNase